MKCYDLVKEELRDFTKNSDGIILNEMNMAAMKRYCEIIDENLKENQIDWFETELLKDTGEIVMRFGCFYYEVRSGAMYEVMEKMTYMGFRNTDDMVTVTFVFPPLYIRN